MFSFCVCVVLYIYIRLNVLTNRKRTPPPGTNMTDLTPYKDNEKSNISSDISYSNSSFSEAPACRVKSNWNPPKGHSAVEDFLSKLEIEIFSVLPGTPLDYNLIKEVWLAMRGLAEDRNIIIKREREIPLAFLLYKIPSYHLP